MPIQMSRRSRERSSDKAIASLASIGRRLATRRVLHRDNLGVPDDPFGMLHNDKVHSFGRRLNHDDEA